MTERKERARRTAPPLDAAAVERLALRYVERFATSRAKLVDYLRRKIGERGLEEGAAPDLPALADRLAELGYIDDRAFAGARARSLGRRGLGARRVTEALRAAGIAEEDRAEAEQGARNEAWAAALRFARRRRIGPFAAVAPDRTGRDKAMAALLRAGHGIDLSRRIAAAGPGEDLDEPA